MNELEKYIINSPLKIMALEEAAAGVGRSTIQHMVDYAKSNGTKGRPLPPHHYPAIIRSLCQPSGGVYIGGWAIVTALFSQRRGRTKPGV